MGAGKGKTRRAQVSAAVKSGRDRPTINEHGRKEWCVDGWLHRDDGPAVEDADGSKLWYQNGDLHRLDGPAVERPDGYKEWRMNGRKHRDDGPAVERANGTKEWWVRGVPHRDGDLPAVEHSTGGGREWWVNGKRHRVNGPAVKHLNGYEAWYVDGVNLTKAEFEEKAAALRLEAARRTAIEIAEREIKTNPEYRNPFGRDQGLR